MEKLAEYTMVHLYNRDDLIIKENEDFYELIWNDLQEKLRSSEQHEHPDPGF